MTFNTFYKGHIGLTKIIADLVEKRARQFGCIKPPRGYWLMKPEQQNEIQEKLNPNYIKIK